MVHWLSFRLPTRSAQIHFFLFNRTMIHSIPLCSLIQEARFLSLSVTPTTGPFSRPKCALQLFSQAQNFHSNTVTWTHWLYVLLSSDRGGLLFVIWKSLPGAASAYPFCSWFISCGHDQPCKRVLVLVPAFRYICIRGLFWNVYSRLM